MINEINNSSASADSVRVYLTEIARFDLLTPEQEIKLGHQVQTWMQISELLIDHNRAASQLIALCDRLLRYPDWINVAICLLTAVRAINELILSILQSEGTDLTRLEICARRARNRLVEANMRLAANVAQRFQHRGMELLDLMQEGAIGLNRAAEKFDPTKGYRFSTYAYWWIRQSIRRAIVDKGRLIRQPLHAYEKLGWIRRAKRELAMELNRQPSLSEMADLINARHVRKTRITAEQIEELLIRDRQTCSFDAIVNADDETRLGDMISDCPPDYTLLNDIESQEACDLLLKDLKEQETEIVLMRFGLLDGKPQTLAKVGKRLGLSHEWIRRIEKEALAKMRPIAETFG